MTGAIRQFCHHCGLPIPTRRDDAHPFCCYGCYLAWRIVGEQGHAGPVAAILARFGIAGVLAMNVMMISLLLYTDPLASIGAQAVQAFRWGLLALSTPVLVILGAPIFAAAYQAARRRQGSMDSLVAVGAIAGFGVSAAHVVAGAGHIYFDTATMLLVLVTLGKLIEASAKARAASALRGLLELTPPAARVLVDGQEKEIPAAELRVGDRLRVRPGERLPADAVIVSGTSTVVESALTGESQPRLVASGDRVPGGGVNGEGEIIVVATAVGQDTLLAQIARLVQEAQARRAPAERLAARAAAAFVPAVLVIAAASLGYWLSRGDLARGGMSALAVLVVACPCALGLATPLAICVALARAPTFGVIIRSGEALEGLAKVSTIFFDKTGTLTEGRPSVRSISACDGGLDVADLLRWLASLEAASEHVMARAIVAAANERGIALGEVADFHAFPGRGAHGRVHLAGESREIWAGTLDFLTAQGFDAACAQALPSPDPAEALVFAAWDRQIRLRVALTDALRPDAAAAIHELQQAGLSVAVLTGDRRAAAEQLGKTLRAVAIKAQCTPADKIEHVRAERRCSPAGTRRVAVVGDGINDAPALAEADVGIAMGGGTDLAREVGQVAILGDRLASIPWALRLARQTRRVIRQNLRWAFGYNLVAITAAFFGYLHPLLAAAAMLVSSLFVLQNSLRLSRFP
jgi:Cu2+-exporting ATPase